MFKRLSHYSAQVLLQNMFPFLLPAKRYSACCCFSLLWKLSTKCKIHFLKRIKKNWLKFHLTRRKRKTLQKAVLSDRIGAISFVDWNIKSFRVEQEKWANGRTFFCKMFQHLVLIASYFEKRCKNRLNTSSSNKLCWHYKMKLFFARNVFFLRIYNCCWKCCCQHTFPLRDDLQLYDSCKIQLQLQNAIANAKFKMQTF